MPQPWLEVDRHAHPEPMNHATAGGKGGDEVDVSVGRHIVPLELKVGIEEPVQAESSIVSHAAIEPTVVEIEVVVAEPELPSAHSAIAFATERILWLDAVEHSSLFVVPVVVVGQITKDLNITAVIHDRIAERVAECRPAIVKEAEQVFALQGPGAANHYKLAVEPLHVIAEEVNPVDDRPILGQSGPHCVAGPKGLNSPRHASLTDCCRLPN